MATAAQTGIVRNLEIRRHFSATIIAKFGAIISWSEFITFASHVLPVFWTIPVGPFRGVDGAVFLQMLYFDWVS